MLRQLVTKCRGSVAVLVGCCALVALVFGYCGLVATLVIGRRFVASSLSLWIDCYESVTLKD